MGKYLRQSVVALLVTTTAFVIACGSGESSPNSTDAGLLIDASGSIDASTVVGDSSSDGGSCGSCFSHGTWTIDNISPCFFQGAGDGGATLITGATSSRKDGAIVSCPLKSTKPTDPWSTDTLTNDCAGHFRLCYTLKAGDITAPGASDCTVGQGCAEGDYAVPSQAQAWTPVESWAATDAQLACAQQFYNAGGYGEMTVTGSTSGCSTLAKTLTRIRYCPLVCNTNPSAAGCAGCVNGGGGTF